MDVTITFRTPFREHSHTGPTLHERTLSAVPPALVERMTDDFVQHRSGQTGSDSTRLYRYEQGGAEVLIALDFSEIIAITATET
jgi:hypothetical protein